MIIPKLSVAAALSVVFVAHAHAAPVTYDVDFKIPGFGSSNTPAGLNLTVTGTITTDGKLGILQHADISDVNVIFDGKTLNEIQISNFYNDASFIASSNGKLTFSFVNTSYANPDRLIFDSPFGRQYIQLFSENGYNFSNVQDVDAVPSISAYSNIVPQGTTLTIGTTAVSAVPLPASAPMFGAALVALGAASFGMKRSRAKARLAR